MAIEQNIADRRAAESLVETTIELVRDEYRKLTPGARLLYLQHMHDRMAKNLKLPCLFTSIRNDEPKKERPESPSEWQSAVDALESLISDCDDIPERGEEFAESVSESAREMASTIEERRHVTEKQWTAIENWQAGVARWLN